MRYARARFELPSACSRCTFGVLGIDLDIKHEAIIGQLHTGRQLRRGFGVRQVVAHVRQIRAARADALNRFERFAQREMRRMRLVAERIEDEGVDAFDESHSRR
jgi:hypothetical protein